MSELKNIQEAEVVAEEVLRNFVTIPCLTLVMTLMNLPFLLTVNIQLSLNNLKKVSYCAVAGTLLRFLIHRCQAPTLRSKVDLKPHFLGDSGAFLESTGAYKGISSF